MSDNISEHGIEIPTEKLSELNKSDADHLQHVPPEVGEGYIGLIEVFHQLHCLVIQHYLLSSILYLQEADATRLVTEHRAYVYMVAGRQV